MSVELHCGDCRDVLKLYPDDHFDICVTDLPYAEETHKGARTSTPGAKSEAERKGGSVLVDFPSITFAECRDILSAAARVTRRWVISTLDWRHCAKLAEDPPDGLEFVRFGVWTKPNGAPQITGDRPGHGWEAIGFLHRPGRKTWHGGGRSSVWTENVFQGTGAYPTQKPLPLIRSFVSLFSGGGPVLDVCMGSGTTGVVCVEKGLPFTGIDLRPEVVERARARIDGATRQEDLFVTKAKPQDLFGGSP